MRIGQRTTTHTPAAPRKHTSQLCAVQSDASARRIGSQHTRPRASRRNVSVPRIAQAQSQQPSHRKHCNNTLGCDGLPPPPPPPPPPENFRLSSALPGCSPASVSGRERR
eukprot:311599-Rhodomonas_salina.2